MRPVIQFEVYYLKDGRWNLHGRFPAAERQESIKEAMSSEGSTGFPTKVIRDTYYPDTNSTETVTIYTSSKYKALAKSATPPPPLVKPQRKGTVRAAAPTQTRPKGAPIGEIVADYLTRAVLSACLSTVGAAFVTGIVSWLLTRMGDAGLPFSPQMSSTLLAFVSIGMFGLGFVAFFRIGGRFRNLIRRMWATASVEAITEQTEVIARQIKISPKDVKPKNPSRAEAELERTTIEVKRQRGDPDVAPQPVDAEAAVAPQAVTPPAPSQPAPKQPEKAPASQVTEPTATPRLIDLIEAKPAATASPSGSSDNLTLERMLLTRFVAERILPLLSDHTEDPITRRGLAYLMSGAVAHLVIVSKLDSVAQDGLLAHGLSQCRLPAGAVDAFRQLRSENYGEAGWQLQDAGRAAMLAYLEGASDTKALSDAWRAWRVPVRLVPKPDAAQDVERPREVYLVTELKHAVHEAIMEFHNRLVRAALEETGGTEIKHTGKGILARYEDCNAAVAAALSIGQSDTTDYGDDAGWFAVALVPGYSDADDPMLSPKVSQVAAIMLDLLRSGDVACDRAVLAHSSRGLPPGTYAHDSQNCVILRNQPPADAPMAGNNYS